MSEKELTARLEAALEAVTWLYRALWSVIKSLSKRQTAEADWYLINEASVRAERLIPIAQLREANAEEK